MKDESLSSKVFDAGKSEDYNSAFYEKDVKDFIQKLKELKCKCSDCINRLAGEELANHSPQENSNQFEQSEDALRGENTSKEGVRLSVEECEILDNLYKKYSNHSPQEKVSNVSRIKTFQNVPEDTERSCGKYTTKIKIEDTKKGCVKKDG